MGLIFHVVCNEKKLTGDACYFRICFRPLPVFRSKY